KINNARETQEDIVIFTNNDKNEDKEQIIKDKKLLLNDNSNPPMDKPVIVEEPTAFTIPFDEPQNPTGALSTSTGFATLKRPKLTSAQHQKSQPAITTTAQ